MVGQKYYAVHNGREGTQIYVTWAETQANVRRVPGVIYKSFRSSGEAQAWLQGIADAMPVNTRDQYPRNISHGPPVSQGGPGPATLAAREAPRAHVGNNGGGNVFYDTMDVDDDSDIEILDGPPSRLQPTPARTPVRDVYEYASDDSDIEILSGPPPNFHSRSSTASVPPRQSSILAQEQSRRQRTPAPQPAQRQQTPAPQPQPPAPLPNGANGGDEAPPATAPAGMLVGGPVRDIQLSPDQLYVLGKVKNGESVFFTGSAGTGKSVLLREIIKYCGGRPSMQLGVTASTGIASVNIGGCTLHSWAGIGLGKDDKDGLVARILGLSARAYKEDVKLRRALWARKARGEQLTADELAFLHTDPSETCKSKVLERWRQVKTLIIDEISMIDGKLFDKLEYIARQLRKNALAFGGIQLVLSGDFCQLPPVPDKSGTGAQIPACFAFDAESWPRCVGRPIILSKVFRQKDQKFVDMLNAMRFGRLDAPTTLSFRLLSRDVKYDDGILPTELYPTRNEVESANSTRLARLEGNPKNYKALDAPGRDENGREFSRDRVERALKDVIAPKLLPLKVGAQVMLIKNIIQGVLVNGSVGRVVGFYKPREAVAMGAQIALPENRDQQGAGMRRAFAGGAGSAPQQGEQDGGEPQELTELEKAQREQKLKAILALNSVWPAVQFQSGPLMLCVPLTFEVTNAEGAIEAVREQVPLILAWALSIHKSQGQTLERVRVDLNRIFEKGQAYVALSRATRMETLQVLNFDPAKVRAHPRVLEWMTQYMGKVPELPYIQDDVDPPNRSNGIEDDPDYWADMVD